MILTTVLLAIVTGAPASTVEQAHQENRVYRSLLDEGINIEGQSLRFSPPRLRDGQSAAEQKGALRKIAGSDGAVAELLRESVSAPFILKVRDEPSSKDPLIRGGELWFAVRADLDAIDPHEGAKRASSASDVEAGNMRFASHLLGSEALSSRSLALPAQARAEQSWYVHLKGRLLDRIHVEATNRVDASRSAESWVIASRTEPAFDDDEQYPNRWSPFIRKGEREIPGKAERYSGGATYVKISRLADYPKMLFVESHFLFAEPKAWFDGAPILRSKISLIVQDQVRRLRREADQKRKGTEAEKPAR